MTLSHLIDSGHERSSGQLSIATARRDDSLDLRGFIRASLVAVQTAEQKSPAESDTSRAHRKTA
jgi:hypothetical protein